MTEAWIIDACRTPRGIGKPGKGALTEIHPQRLGATVLRALKERNDIKTEEVDDIVWGTSSQNGKQGGDLGRMAALDAGYDIKASGMTLDRFCGSGITTVNIAAANIMCGMEDMTIAGGTEMMSLAGTVDRSQSGPTFDAGNLHLRALHPQTNQGVCGDAIATLDDIDSLAGPSPYDLAALARTFTAIPHPVWVHDRYDRCLYVNESARRLNGRGMTALRHEIVDHRNQTVGRLTIGQQTPPIRLHP